MKTNPLTAGTLIALRFQFYDEDEKYNIRGRDIFKPSPLPPHRGDTSQSITKIS